MYFFYKYFFENKFQFKTIQIQSINTCVINVLFTLPIFQSIFF